MRAGREVEVLLVEDNPADAELTLHSLRQHSLADHVRVARDGVEALDFLFCRGAFAGRSFTDPPTLVLLDIKLPKVDGLEVLRQLKADPRTQPIPVVMLTSSNIERDLVTSYQSGVNSYVQKPVEFGQFREAVKQVGLYWLLENEPPPPSAFAG
ncbi:MAG TPA: response regulator [Gemmatimonadales bacterium]|nr:response regulator [Gemmatimonadales bacterium]